MIRQAREVQLQNILNLQPGQRLEARRNTITCYRGRIDQIALEIEVIWIREEPSGERKMLHFADYNLWLLHE